MKRIFIIAALAMLLAGCASSLSGDYAKGGKGKTMLVSQTVWGSYQEYLTKISGVYKGLFVVALYNGVAESSYYYYCPGASCYTANYAKKAMDGCRSLGGNPECVLFANSGDIQVNYKLLDN